MFGVSIMKSKRLSIKNQGFSIKDDKIVFKIHFKLKDSLWNSIMKGFIIILLKMKGFYVKTKGFQSNMKGFPLKFNLNCRISFGIQFQIKGFNISNIITMEELQLKSRVFH